MPRRRSHAEFISSSTESHLPQANEPQAGGNSRQTMDDWFSVTYKELRRLAAAVKRSDMHATISTSTLVHEAWIKLANAPGLEPQSELHFKRLAARVMRHIVMDEARRRRAYKRGGGGVAMFVTLDDSMIATVSNNDDLLRLDAALDALALVDSRQAELVQLRFFGGLGVTEASTLLGIAESTASRDWRVAKAWLAAKVRRGR